MIGGLRKGGRSSVHPLPGERIYLPSPGSLFVRDDRNISGSSVGSRTGVGLTISILLERAASQGSLQKLERGASQNLPSGFDATLVAVVPRSLAADPTG